jgi:hypothetical protein
VIADRHIFVVGQQRRVRPEDAADIHRVVYAGIEIRVVADLRREMHDGVARVEQEALHTRALGRALLQKGRKSAPQGAALVHMACQERVQRRLCGALAGRCRFAGKQSRCEARSEIENPVADGDTRARLTATDGKDAEGQILDGKVGVAVCRIHKAPARRIVRLVERDHRGPGKFFGSVLPYSP